MIFLCILIINLTVLVLPVCLSEKTKRTTEPVLKKLELEENNVKKVEDKRNENSVKKDSNQKNETEVKPIEEQKNDSEKKSIQPKAYDVPFFIPSEKYKSQLRENDYEMVAVGGSDTKDNNDNQDALKKELGLMLA
uniref:Uncharacterized protein n=1 Tax=Parastrongyloides trichosuri TaxID=131310 RepID=A0A0N4ZF90_PARTI